MRRALLIRIADKFTTTYLLCWNSNNWQVSRWTKTKYAEKSVDYTCFKELAVINYKNK